MLGRRRHPPDVTDIGEAFRAQQLLGDVLGRDADAGGFWRGAPWSSPAALSGGPSRGTDQARDAGRGDGCHEAASALQSSAWAASFPCGSGQEGHGTPPGHARPTDVTSLRRGDALGRERDGPRSAFRAVYEEGRPAPTALSARVVGAIPALNDPVAYKARGSREVDLKSTIIPDRLTFFLLIDVVVYHLAGDGAGCDDQDEVNLEVVARKLQGGIVA